MYYNKTILRREERLQKIRLGNIDPPESCQMGSGWKKKEKIMAEDYRNQAIGVFELESECICFVALDAAAKAAAVKIQGVERNRLASGACVKMRGSVSDVKAAMEAALDVARPLTKIVSHTVIASPSEDTEKAIAMTINK